MEWLFWGLGMALAIMIGGALGGSFVQERGRKVLPIVIVLTVVTGLLLGWALDGEFGAVQATSEIR